MRVYLNALTRDAACDGGRSRRRRRRRLIVVTIIIVVVAIVIVRIVVSVFIRLGFIGNWRNGSGWRLCYTERFKRRDKIGNFRLAIMFLDIRSRRLLKQAIGVC